MPIIRARYNAGFPLLSLVIKVGANWTCQHCGQACRQQGETWNEFSERTGLSWEPPPKWQRYILTTAHLDQDTRNDDPDNLRALCTVCHLAHDRPYRTRNIYAKREWFGQLNLFWLETPALLHNPAGLSGVQLPLTLASLTAHCERQPEPSNC